MTRRRLSVEERAIRKDKGVRRPGSVGVRLLEFFRANPDEELTEEQAATKLDAALPNLQYQLRGLREEGLIERVTVLRLTRKGRDTA